MQASEKNYGQCFSTEVNAACTHSANLERETEITKIVTYPLFPLAFSYVKDGRANRQYGNTDTDKAYYPEMGVEGQDIVLDSSKIEKHNFGRGHDTMPLGWLAPGFAVNKQLAFDMGWFVENYNSNPK